MNEQAILDREEKERAAHRPGLLKVLCILTWIGSVAQFTVTLGVLLNDLDPFLHSPSLLVNNVGIQAGNILAVIGAVMMWRMKRNGFWIYILAEIIPLIPGVIIMLQRDEFSDIRAAGVVGGIFLVRIAFIAMYARYYKIFR